MQNVWECDENEECEMNIIIYEEDLRRRLKLKQILSQLYDGNPKVKVSSIHNEEEGFINMEREYIDVAFISWEDQNGSGQFLSEKLKKKEYRLNIIVMSQQYKYIEEFWKWHMSGYITGEFTREKILKELRNLRYT